MALLTDDLQEDLLTAHGICVDLAHVPASVVLVDLVDVQSPDLLVVVRQRHALVARDDVVVDGEDGLRVHAHPRHLHTRRA